MAGNLMAYWPLFRVCCMPVVCILQALMRLLMTCIIMSENIVRILLQAMYNCCSFGLQVLALIPVCIVFVITSRLKCCFMCAGGCDCAGEGMGGARGPLGDCSLSFLCVILTYFICDSFDLWPGIFGYFGYAKATQIKIVTIVYVVNVTDDWKG